MALINPSAVIPGKKPLIRPGKLRFVTLLSLPQHPFPTH